MSGTSLADEVEVKESLNDIPIVKRVLRSIPR